MLTDLINITQVGLTVTFAGLALLLLRTWWPGFQVASSEARDSWTPEQWLIVGIVVGFAGGLADQAYWGLHWLSELYQHSSQPWLLKNGPLSNLFARQLPGIISVYCHLRAAQGMTEELEMLSGKTLLYCFLGLGTFTIISIDIFY